MLLTAPVSFMCRHVHMLVDAGATQNVWHSGQLVRRARDESKGLERAPDQWRVAFLSRDGEPTLSPQG